jgi:hypothetical protein
MTQKGGQVELFAYEILTRIPFDRILPLGYNSVSRWKTPAIKPLFGVLITFIRSK